MQEFAVGVTETIAFTGAAPKLIAVKLSVSAEPFDGRPIDELEFVQLKVVPATVLENADAEITEL